MARSMAELDALATIDPEIEAVIKSGRLKMPPIDYDDNHKAVTQMRQIMQAYENTSPIDGVVGSPSTYLTRDGTTNRVLVYKPSLVTEKIGLPLIVMFHGGGGAVGSPEGTSIFCQNLALTQNAVVVSAAYRLAPEFPFPTGVDDCWDFIQFLVKDGANDLGADLRLGFVVGGHSNGASIAAVAALRGRDEGLSPNITGLYLGAGAFIAPGHLPEGYDNWYLSRKDERCINAPILNPVTRKMFDDAYAPDPDSAWYRICNYTGEAGLKHLPKTYFQTCGMEILRDDSLIFENILQKNGVETKLNLYPGCPHIFWTAFSMTSQYAKWAQDTQQGFKWLLNVE